MEFLLGTGLWIGLTPLITQRMSSVIRSISAHAPTKPGRLTAGRQQHAEQNNMSKRPDALFQSVLENADLRGPSTWLQFRWNCGWSWQRPRCRFGNRSQSPCVSSSFAEGIPPQWEDWRSRFG